MKKNLHKRTIRIKKAAPLPSVAVTNQYKDFSKVMGTYSSTIREIHKKPLYKKRGLFLGILLLAVIAVLVFNAVEDERALKNPPVKTEQGLFVDSLDNKTESYQKKNIQVPDISADSNSGNNKLNTPQNQDSVSENDSPGTSIMK